jgi:uncharacterized protein involved in exopolysaccharide biosynthesis
MAILATSVAFLLTPLYRSSVVLIPARSDTEASALRSIGGLGSLASLAGLSLGGDGEQTVEAVALLKSRQLAVGFIRDKELMPLLYPDEWDTDRKAWKVSGDKVPTMSDAYEYFNEKVRRVSEDRRSGLVTLSIDWHEPNLAAAWATDLVSRVNELMRARAITESDASIEQLKDRLANTSVVPLQQGISGLMESQIKRKTFATVRSEYAFRVVDPASVPDKKDRIYPRKPLFAVLGFLAGMLIGALLALVLGLRGSGKRAS